MTGQSVQAYKPTNIPWIGSVPEGWTVCALNYRYEVALGKMLDEKQISGKHLAPYVRNADVQWGRINTTNLPRMDFDEDDRARFSLRHGDVLVCEGGEVGRAAVWEGAQDCYYQKAIHRLRPRSSDREEPRFLYWTLRATADAGAFTAGENKSTISHLTAEAFRRFQFAFPPLAAQRKIASFVDSETTRIDSLIARQDRLIGLLREKRQALITRAVTSGLDPTVPMKYSGVAWLGEVPSHWKMTRIKHLVRSIEQGWSPECENRPAEDGEWAVLKVGCVNGDVFNPSENKALPANLSPVPALTLKRGDVLVSRANTRDLVGSCAIVPHDQPQLMLCDKLYRIIAGTAVAQSYLARMIATFGRREVELSATGASASMVNIGQGTIMNLVVPLPPLHEQDEILAALSNNLAIIEQLNRKIQRSVELAREHRAALISAAVTGKIDVRQAFQPVTSIVEVGEVA